MEDRMAPYYLAREQVKQQIIQNLVEAGVATRDEATEYLHELNRLDNKDLLAVLLESHITREASQPSGIPTAFYHIDPRSMGNLN